MLYYVLDQKKGLDVVLHTTSGAICKEFGLTKKEFKNHLNNNTPIQKQYVIIEAEGEEEEEWICCYKVDTKSYFISSMGNFRMYERLSKKYYTGFIKKIDGKEYVCFEGKQIPLIELVAKWHCAEWYDGCNTKIKNPAKDNRIYAENIVVCARKAQVKKVVMRKGATAKDAINSNNLGNIKVGIYFNNELTKVFNSVEECSQELKINADIIRKQISNNTSCNGLKYIN